MVVKKIPENAAHVIPYEVRKNTLSLNDDEIAVNLAKKERDDAVHLDFCFDYLGGLVSGVGDDTQKYVAQVDIPARKYTETEEDNPDYDPNEEGTEGTENRRTITKRTPVPFSMDNVVLTLWEVEEA